MQIHEIGFDMRKNIRLMIGRLIQTSFFYQLPDCVQNSTINSSCRSNQTFVDLRFLILLTRNRKLMLLFKMVQKVIVTILGKFYSVREMANHFMFWQSYPKHFVTHQLIYVQFSFSRPFSFLLSTNEKKKMIWLIKLTFLEKICVQSIFVKPYVVILSRCLIVCLSVCLSFCLSVCLSLSPSLSLSFSPCCIQNI